MTDPNNSSGGLRVKWREPNGSWLNSDWFQGDGTFTEYEGFVQGYLSVDGVPKAVVLVGSTSTWRASWIWKWSCRRPRSD